jgi:hypothetical protein
MVRAHMSMTRLGGCAAVLCAVAAPVAAAPIVGGSADGGDPAVVLFAAYPADMSTLFTCTAVVIAPKVLLTAGHCADHAGYTFGAFYGSDGTGSLAQLAPQLAAVSSVTIFPGYDRSAPFVGDIAIANLADAAPGAPIPYAREAPTAAMVGSAVRIVGYGETVAGTNAAKKLAAETVIAALDTQDNDTVTIGDATHHTCIGDSGGPALYATGSGEIILGVDSYADDSGCDGPSHFRRTDAYLAFLDAAIGLTPGGADAGAGGDGGVSADAGSGIGVPIGEDNKSGGCAAFGGDGSLAAAALLAVLPVLRRRRRR